jgi:hypothetical protein
MTTPDEGELGGHGPEPTNEWRRPVTGRQQCAIADTTGGPPATTPGLVVTEERLADGRRITYYGTSR